MLRAVTHESQLINAMAATAERQPRTLAAAMIAVPAMAAGVMAEEAEIERYQNHPDYSPVVAGVSPVALWLYAAADRSGKAHG